MVPDLDLQLQVVLKALGDTVKPALDPGDKPAAEQLGLAMATLAMVRDHLPIQRRFTRRMLEDAIRFAEALDAANGTSGLAGPIAAARAMLTDPEAEAHEIEACRGELSRSTVALLAEAGEAGVAKFGPLIVAQSKPIVEKIRAWFAGSGFEAGAADFRPIAELL